MARLNQLALKYIEASSHLTELTEKTQIPDQLQKAIDERRIGTALALGARTLYHAVPFAFQAVRFTFAYEADKQARIDFPIEIFEESDSNSQMLTLAEAIVASDIE